MALEIHHGLVGQAPVHQTQGEVGARLQVPLAALHIRDADDDPVGSLGQHLEGPVQGAENQLDGRPALTQPLEDHADGLDLLFVEVPGGHGNLSDPARQTQASSRMVWTAV